jgi:ubiquitin carboxyl-terminal hydrolase 10
MTSSETQIRRPVSPDEGWLEVGKKQKTHVVRSTENRESAITRIFGGTLRSVLHTPGSKDSVTLEPYQPLQLDIQSPAVLSISDALKNISEPEIVPGVWSAARKTNVDATKQVYIDSFPPVLILHLKRFVYDPMEQNVVKRFKPVGYGIDLSVPQEVVAPGKRGVVVKYRLFGGKSSLVKSAYNLVVTGLATTLCHLRTRNTELTHSRIPSWNLRFRRTLHRLRVSPRYQPMAPL